MLSARRYGATVEGPVNNPYLMNEGDEIEFTCNGNIGSSTSLQFEWWITGNMGLIKFRPEIQTQGEAMQGSTACTYSRTTTMRYNITATDRNRGSLTFMCFAQVSPPSPAPSYPKNSTAFYITICKLCKMYSSQLRQPQAVACCLLSHCNRHLSWWPWLLSFKGHGGWGDSDGDVGFYSQGPSRHLLTIVSAWSGLRIK